MAVPYLYLPQDWYWIVGAGTTIVYSSKSASYVPVKDATYVTFVAAGGRATAIDTEADLEAVLAAQYPAGWTSTSSASAATAAAA